ncbi:MAG: bifunctional UDP-sugar hydrolase/5'-nucleotidase [Bacteroidota bacterium]
MKHLFRLLLTVSIVLSGCSNKPKGEETGLQHLTIFFVNDVHGKLENFARIGHIVELEEEETNVMVVCSGDIFSGNPVVDHHPEKGYPMIDLMNRVGFDIVAVGNHEFDYGQSILADRMKQAEFDWVCANIDMGNTGIPEPFEYSTLSVDDVKVTFLGVIETGGKKDDTIPSTHPLKVEGITFQSAEQVIPRYEHLKEQEKSDLLIVLSHLGHDGKLGDFQMASQYPYFDMIIGGHSHWRIDTTINHIPVFQAGSKLNYLGKIELTILNREVQTVNFDLIDLDTCSGYDPEISNLVDEYQELPHLHETIGSSGAFHEPYHVGCLITDAYRSELNVDVSLQNKGGVRSSLDEGDISKTEIFQIAPFNNRMVIIEITVSELKHFLKESATGFFYSGIEIRQTNDLIQIMDLQGNALADTNQLTLGTNDYITAVHETILPENVIMQSLTDVEVIISFLAGMEREVDYSGCDRFFRYQEPESGVQ